MATPAGFYIKSYENSGIWKLQFISHNFWVITTQNRRFAYHIHGLSHVTNMQVTHTPTQMEAHIKSPLLTPYATFGNRYVPPVSNEKLYVI